MSIEIVPGWCMSILRNVAEGKVPAQYTDEREAITAVLTGMKNAGGLSAPVAYRQAKRITDGESPKDVAQTLLEIA